jgi:hypothetical protein
VDPFAGVLNLLLRVTFNRREVFILDVDTDQDRYPSFTQALRSIIEHAELGEDACERLEVNTFANGDVTYRFWPPRAEESVGGYISGEE